MTTRGAVPLMLVAALSGCDELSWTAFVYPDRSDLLSYQRFGPFSTLEDCRRGAKAAIGSNAAADYECGSDCKPSELTLDLFVCNATVR